MPYEVGWFVPRRVMYCRFYGVMTVDDTYAANTIMTRMIRDGDAPVHNLIFADEVTKIPFDLKLLQNSNGFLKEPHLGWTIFIPPNPMIRFFASTLGQLAGARVRVVSTYEDALGTLERLDAALVEFLPADKTA